MKNLERITIDPGQMGGVPCVRGQRIPVATVLRLLAGGLTEAEILAEYPDLEQEDIRACLQFAAAEGGVGRQVSYRIGKSGLDHRTPSTGMI